MLVKQKGDKDDGYSSSREVYFTGESYAGHYIPTIVDYILHQNENLSSGSLLPTIFMPIAGIAIGNGYLDPHTGYNNAMAEYGHGLMDLSQKAYLDTMEIECNKLVDAKAAEDDAMDCLDTNFEDFDVSGIHANVEVCDYDVRLWLPAGRQSELYPPGRTALESYINEPKVLEAIHAKAFVGKHGKFKVQTSAVRKALGDYYNLVSVTEEVVRILHHDVRVLFYNGILDLMCDHYTNERFLNQLPWKGRSDWVTAKRYAWNPFWKYNKNGDIVSLQRPSGFAKEYGNLSFLKILDAGHLVPMDQPGTHEIGPCLFVLRLCLTRFFLLDVSLAMLKTFLHSKPFMGAEQKLEQLDSMDRVPVEWSPACETTMDGSISWIVLGCILLAGCFGFLAGRWSSKKSTNYASLPVNNGMDEQSPNHSCLELSSRESDHQ